MNALDLAAPPRRVATRTGATLWLTGLPSAGKSTLAGALAASLPAAGGSRRVEVLDGDDLREHLTAGLGFSREDRDINVQRIAFVARLLARNGVLAVVPVIAPYSDTRSEIRRAHASEGTPYVEVHVATPLDVCAGRDVKGLYARQRAGELTGLTGVDDPYEVPTAPDLRLDTSALDLPGCVTALHQLLEKKGLL